MSRAESEVDEDSDEDSEVDEEDLEEDFVITLHEAPHGRRLRVVAPFDRTR